MTTLRTWIGTHRQLTIVTAVIAGTVFLAAAGIGAARATDSPEFCRAACHEMAPYTQAWSQGPHAGVECVDCHVDAGTAARLRHKLVALREVQAHLEGDYAFPMDGVAPIPDSRCVRCHEDTLVDTPGFDHDAHAGRGSCQSCHTDAGHLVTDGALRDAGVLAEGARAVGLTSRVANADGGSANIEGHVSVSCSRCHDMKRTGCDACHDPDHDEAGLAEKTAACVTCHEPGATFAFSHPAAEDGCEDCHARPADHRTGECASCHEEVAEWAFAHPSKSSECTDCHTRPANHESGACVDCHKTGRSWAFRHPASSTCTSCHPRPASHRSGSCTSCHASRTSWAFAHPGRTSTCTSCHTRPSGHAAGACVSCHQSGSSWSFTHTGSTACASCHKAPSGHYGSSCSSCHSPSKSWGNARFSHPRIPGGEHSYRSFACSKCHPSGYGSSSCARCHDSASGPRDDDDEDDD